MTTQQKLISILGTTATGKTALALSLAKYVIHENKARGVCLISADSRQVYQGLEILSGADIPPDFNIQKSKTCNTFFQHHQMPITLHGISLISPQQEWSVAHFRNMAISLIQQAWQNQWWPIIVGGTSFYHKQLFNNDPDIYIKPNIVLRKKLENQTTQSLQLNLKKIDITKFTQMNFSDQNNPRRLIRAIEVTQFLQKKPTVQIIKPNFQKPKAYFSIALAAEISTLKQKITQRINQRLKSGALQQVKWLLSLQLDQQHPALTTLGVKPLTLYLNNQIDLSLAKEQWLQEEINYAKKQITWIKKFKADLTKSKIEDIDFKIII